MPPFPLHAPRGILSRPTTVPGIHHARFAPAPALQAFIAHFWTVRWDLRGKPPFVAETLPHPCVHLLFEDGGAQVAGIQTQLFRRRLQGKGSVFGIKFRPATFHPLLRAPLASLRDRVVPLASVFGAAGSALGPSLCAAPDAEGCVRLAETFLQERLPAMPAAVAALRDLVERLATDGRITRVEQAAALAGVDVRSLQRRFRTAVGVSPKWVIQRYRLHEAAERLSSPKPPALAQLALELGYCDQPHFIRSFKAVTGRAPGRQAFRTGRVVR